jgi:hypothetical protein
MNIESSSRKLEIRYVDAMNESDDDALDILRVEARTLLDQIGEWCFINTDWDSKTPFRDGEIMRKYWTNRLDNIKNYLYLIIAAKIEGKPWYSRDYEAENRNKR